MARRYGRAPRGRRLRVGVPHGRWKTITVVAGLRTSGVVAPFVLDGPINRAAFEAYVEKVLVPELRPGAVVILDNLSSHTGARVRALIEAAGASLLDLPPTALISTRLRMPSPSSKRSCARPPSAPSRGSGPPSATCSTHSPQPSAPTTSLPQDTMQPERKTL